MSSTTGLTDAIKVGVVMGSSSDWDVMRHAADILTEFGVPFEAQVVSAHRMPDDMFRYAEAAVDRGLVALIAGAGGAVQADLLEDALPYLALFHRQGATVAVVGP